MGIACVASVYVRVRRESWDENKLPLYLSRNRLNRVKIKDVTSDWKRMVFGPSFGPLRWNFFQNDMSFHINNANLSMYADDHQMYVMRGKKHDVVAQSIKIQGEQALS